jgi:hypothetical protein
MCPTKTLPAKLTGGKRKHALGASHPNRVERFEPSGACMEFEIAANVLPHY